MFHKKENNGWNNIKNFKLWIKENLYLSKQTKKYIAKTSVWTNYIKKVSKQVTPNLFIVDKVIVSDFLNNDTNKQLPKCFN